MHAWPRSEPHARQRARYEPCAHTCRAAGRVQAPGCCRRGQGAVHGAGAGGGHGGGLPQVSGFGGQAGGAAPRVLEHCCTASHSCSAAASHCSPLNALPPALNPRTQRVLAHTQGGLLRQGPVRRRDRARGRALHQVRDRRPRQGAAAGAYAPAPPRPPPVARARAPVAPDAAPVPRAAAPPAMPACLRPRGPAANAVSSTTHARPHARASRPRRCWPRLPTSATTAPRCLMTWATPSRTPTTTWRPCARPPMRCAALSLFCSQMWHLML